MNKNVHKAGRNGGKSAVRAVSATNTAEVMVEELEPQKGQFIPAVAPAPVPKPVAHYKPFGLFDQKPLVDLIYIYLQEMDERSLFTGTQEVEKAQQVQVLRDELWGKILSLKFVDPSPYPEFSDLLISDTASRLAAWVDDLRRNRKSERQVWKESGLTKKRLLKTYHEVVSLKSRLEKKRNEFVEANLRLVVKIANRYRNHAVNVADLIQEGNLGLIRAVEKFDWTKGFKFSSYATWWIHQAIIRALAEKSKLIKIPVYLTEKVRRLGRATRVLSQELEKEPNLDELSKKMGMDSEEVLNLMRISKDPVSLEGQVGDMEEVQVGDMIEDPNAIRADEFTARQALLEHLENSLKLLTPREEQVLRLRYGLGGEEIRTLEEIGAMFGVSRERVRQIEQKGLRKLRHPARSKALRNFFKN
jgi:RNA polymerase sigma factor (sigma-70 family)